MNNDADQKPNWREFWITRHPESVDVDKLSHIVLGDFYPENNPMHVIEAAPALAEIESLRAENAELKRRMATVENDYGSTCPNGCSVDKREVATHGHGQYYKCTETECEMTWMSGRQQSTYDYNKLSAATAQMEKLAQALIEAKQHFNSISSGLTTDINRVEHLTKSLAHAAHVEVRLALAHYEQFKKESGRE